MLITTDHAVNREHASIDKTLARFGVTHESLVAEILHTVTPDSLTQGAKWYQEANRFARQLADYYGFPIERVVGVISAVSPRMGWPRNKVLAEHILSSVKTRDSATDDVALAKAIGGALGANVLMAVRIARGAPIDATLTGVKRRSFYNNILAPGNSDSVTVDTWMQRVAMRATNWESGMDLDDSLKFLNAARTATGGVGAGYVAIADAVRAAAVTLGTSPDTVQAAYWIVASGSVHGWHYKGHNLDAEKY